MKIRNKLISTVALILVIATVISGCSNPPVSATELDPVIETLPVVETQHTEPPMEENPPVGEEPVITELSNIKTDEENKDEVADVTVVSEVPKYNQLDYYYVPYGNYGTVKTHGCGITCLAMVATYLLDDPSMTPDVLAERFGYYNTKWGSSWTLFTDSAEVLGLGKVTQVHDWTHGVEDALRNGCLVISNQVKGVFTNGGHYILLTGMTEDGKVMVHDPNGAAWNSNTYKIDGFANGFKVTAVSATSTAYWIYEPKK